MAQKDPDFYGVLGVPRTATETEVRRGERHRCRTKTRTDTCAPV